MRKRQAEYVNERNIAVIHVEIWKCEHCGQSFDRAWECHEHENKCSQNDKKKEECGVVSVLSEYREGRFCITKNSLLLIDSKKEEVTMFEKRNGRWVRYTEIMGNICDDGNHE